MNLNKDIYECLFFLIDSHSDIADWDGEGFIENKDLIISKSLLKINHKKWTSKMAFNAYKLLELYKDYLEDYHINLNDIEQPDYIEEEVVTDSDLNVVNIEKNKFIISNITDNIKKYFFNSIQIDNNLIMDLNINNLFIIHNLIEQNKIKINKKYLNFINMYLNLIDYDNINEKDLCFEYDHYKNFNFKLKSFQFIGCLYILLNKRIILGDDMGLGKTIQSIASIELSQQKPCLIICPNNLKLNWKSEISKNLNNQKIELINNKTNNNSDYYIINYESLNKYYDKIKDLNLKSVIMDESHYLKNIKAKRTINCLNIIRNIEYRIALTGTAILKSPADLIAQLKILNRLDFFGGETNFIDNFCGSATNQWGKKLKNGASNLDKLNRKLRESCFLRREKSQVIKDLPEKTRTYIPIEINMKKYLEESINFKNLKPKDKLKKIEKLRQITSREKLKSATEWIDNFLENDKKLVVFAYHQEIQKELLKKYPESAKIVSKMSDIEKENNKNEFMNNPKCKLIICSIKSAQLGLTLTSASDVFFAEMDWCAGNNNQAEDRCHRITQKNAVNVWYMVAKNTIDEHIQEVVESKRKLIDNIYNTNNFNKLNELDIVHSSIKSEIIEKMSK